MASRAEQKAALRAAREARQKELTATQTRRKRMYSLGALLAGVVVALIVVIVAGSSKSPTKPANNKSAVATVAALLKGIPQNGNTLGKPTAPVTVTEYGDLVCPICQEFAFGSEQQLIKNEVRSGKVKLVYRGVETASSQANGGEYVASQVAARAAGQQHRAWQYIMLWYYEQGDETTPYVTNAFMQNIAAQVPGLNLTKWQTDRNDAALTADVTADAQAAQAAGLVGPQGPSTPSITFVGPKGAAQPIVGLASYAQLQSEIQPIS
jgi:protein-disulfide isomerase